jgi:hypothetical protein
MNAGGAAAGGPAQRQLCRDRDGLGVDAPEGVDSKILWKSV